MSCRMDADTQYLAFSSLMMLSLGMLVVGIFICQVIAENYSIPSSWMV